MARDGAHRFTTARVAEKAGVSVGSLYQYFPNKEAILFRLQFAEWGQTTALLNGILADTAMPVFDRVRLAVREFFRTEWEEAEMRLALGDAAPLYRNAPEAQEHRQSGTKALLAFLREAIPSVPSEQQALAADVIAMALGALGKGVSEREKSLEQVDEYARAVGQMFCAYLETLAANATGEAYTGSLPR